MTKTIYISQDKNNTPISMWNLNETDFNNLSEEDKKSYKKYTPSI